MRLLKIIGFANLLLLAFSMFVFKYGFLDRQQDFLPALNHWQYALLVVACVLIAAGGFLMNNVFGFGKDPHPVITEAKGYNIYIVLTLAGVSLGYYIASITGKTIFTGIFVIAAATLYIYATSLKQTVLVSNIIIALTLALPIVAIGIFNLYPVITENNQRYLATLFDLLLDYAIFTFIIGLILSFVRDLANNDADYNEGITTLPITLGKARTVKIVFVFTLLPVSLIVYYFQLYIISLTWALGYGLLFILGPLVYFLIKLWSAKTQNEFKHLETVLKLVLLFTALSVAVLTFNIHYNAKG